MFSVEAIVVRECDIKYCDRFFDIDIANAGVEDVEATQEAEDWVICCFRFGRIVSTNCHSLFLILAFILIFSYLILVFLIHWICPRLIEILLTIYTAFV